MVQNIQQCDEPTQPRIGLLLHHWGPCPLLFLNSRVDYLTPHKKQMCESPLRWDPTVFHPYPRRLQSLFSDVIAKAALSRQLFKDPKCWFGQGVGPARVLVRPECWFGEGVGLARVLVWPGCWSGRGVGPAQKLVRPGCWSGRGVGPAGVLVRPGCWSGRGVGLAGVLVWLGCWSGQGVGPARVLVWPGCWSGQCLYPRPPAQQTSTLPTELMYSC